MVQDTTDDPRLEMGAQDDAWQATADEQEEPGEDELETRRLQVDVAAHGQRLDRVLTGLAPEFSRNYLQTLIADGHVRLNGQPQTTPAHKLRIGTLLEIDLVRPPHERAFLPQAMDLDIVYEDAHLMVVNKPAGLVVHPAAGNWSGTLLNGLLARDPAAATLPRAGIVHRLDKDTSGLMVVGRSLAAVTGLSRDIAARTVHRQYLALAHGRLQEGPFSIEAPIGRDPKARVRMAVVSSGKPGRTDVEMLAFGSGDGLGNGAGIAAVRCTLHTGRTHQIRVHMAFRGHPLIGDATYGGRPLLDMNRQALHAVRLAFTHPVTGEALSFQAAPPADFQAAWQAVDGPDV